MGDGSDARWERVKEILEAAIEAPPHERETLLDRLCAGDADLRGEVDSLLVAHDDVAGGGDFFGAEDHPDRVGRYRILRPIAKGGMGVVYLAEQTEPIRRQVAIKLIQIGMDTREVVARFDLERQALALMSHPNIAQVLDADSTAGGRPYFVMEYVPGVPITQYCDEHTLGIRERLELFLRVCDAIQHAHQKGVVHRDVKPSNVLVAHRDGEAVPKVIDFGIAKATSLQLTRQTLFTRAGVMVGTPEYVSPEQASMTETGVDTRTDVYSLGVLLYELLTGYLPFGRSGDPDTPLDEILRRIRLEEPTRPSARLAALGAEAAEVARRRRSDVATIVRSLGRDLDWIILRSLEKDPGRRYPSVSELAADVRRHLHDEPVDARPPSAMYRARSFVRRHRLGVAVASTALAGVVLVTGVVAVQARRIAKERDVAEREARTAEAVTAFLIDMFDSADPAAGGDRTLTAEEILDAATKELDRSLGGQPEVRVRLMTSLARVHLSLSDYVTAERLSRAALEIQEKRVGFADRDLVRPLVTLAASLNSQSKYEEALTVGERALRIAESNLAYDGLAIADALDPYIRTLRETERLDEALSSQERQLAILEADAVPSRRRIAESLMSLYSIYDERGDPDGGEPALRRAQSLLEVELGPDHPFLADAIALLANCRGKQGRLDEAIRLGERALEIRRAAYGETHDRTAFSLYNLAVFHANAGRLREASDLLSEAEAIWIEVVGPEHENLGYVYRMQGRLLLELGDPVAAEEALRKAVDLDRRIWGESHGNYILSLGRLGRALAEQGQYAEARPMLAAELDHCRAEATDVDATPFVKFVFVSRTLECPLEELKDRATALRVAEEANRMTNGADAEVLEALARLRFETGDAVGAVEAQAAALAATPPDREESRQARADRLKEFRRTAVGTD